MMMKLFPWIAFLAALVTTGVGRAQAAQPVSRPNIVFILADDLGWGDVGYNGGAIPTPHLDRLAHEGAILTQHYVAPVCTPTRAGLLTGRYWSRFGVYFVQATQALPFNTVTLPSALKRVGYDTALIGKWHLGSKPDWGPNHFGFDYSYGSLGGGVGPFDHRYKHGPYTHTWHRNNELIEEEGHITDLLGDEDVKWISQPRTAPFFLYAAFTAPHVPVREPAAWLDKVPPNVVAELQRRYAAHAHLPSFAVSRTTSEALARNYAACVMHLDYEVGRIVEALDRAGKRKDTLIIFTSDNGSPTGVQNADPEYPADDYPPGPIPGNNDPFRGYKTELYEGGIHVAAVANWPGVLAPGNVGQPIAIVDWMPTLCRLAGCRPAIDVKWDGIDVWPFLTRETTRIVRRQLYTGYHTGNALRDGDWKLIVPNDAAAKPELFNVSRDPGETTNLAAEAPSEVERLTRELKIAQRSDQDAVVPPEK
jgi:arylsulfatase A-like enzyme